MNLNPEEIQEEQRLHFAGISGTENTTLPDWYTDTQLINDDDGHTFLDIVHDYLPNAKPANLFVENPLADEDTELDAVDNWKAIIDPRRARLAADGHDTKYLWHVPTKKYSIVPPLEAYSPLISTLRQYGLDKDIFGQVFMRDFGGEVYIRMFFESKQITGLPGDSEDPVYLGLETGYDFKGGRAVYCNMVGYDSYSGGVIRNITKKKSRRHVGDATNEAHERDNDRVPIQEWWAEMIERIDAMTDELTDAIQQASQVSLAFTHGGELATIPTAYVGSFDHVKPYDAASFFTLHDMPDYLAESAAAKAADYGDDIRELTFWELFRGLTDALESQERCDEGTTLNAYADTAMDLLWDSQTSTELADEQWNYELEQEDLNTEVGQQVIVERESEQTTDGPITATFGPDSTDETSTSDDGLMEKRRKAQERQQSLKDYVSQF